MVLLQLLPSGHQLVVLVVVSAWSVAHLHHLTIQIKAFGEAARLEPVLLQRDLAARRIGAALAENGRREPDGLLEAAEGVLGLGEISGGREKCQPQTQ